jgi:hypothetical protein
MRLNRRCAFAHILFAVMMACAVMAQAGATAQPIPVKVVVVTMFERGEDTAMFQVNISYGSSASISTRFFRCPQAIAMSA